MKSSIKGIKLKHKILAAFLFMAMLVVICGIAGLYGATKLGGAIEDLAGPAWSTADGAMEGTIGLELQMLAIRNIISDIEPDINKVRLEEGRKMAHDGFDSASNSGKLAQADVEAFGNARETYNKSLDEVLTTFNEFDNARDVFDEHTAKFVEFLVFMEELGDGAVEHLENNPDEQTTWNSGLSTRWAAADGGMESTIGYYQQLYFLEQLRSGRNSEDCLKGIEAGREFQAGAAEEMLATGMFDVPADEAGFPGMTMAEAYRKLFEGHVAKLDAYARAYLTMAEADVVYQSAANSVLSLSETYEDIGDQAVESQKVPNEELRRFTVRLLWAVMFASLIAAFLCAMYVTGKVIKPLEGVVYRLRDIAEGEGDLTQRIDLKQADEIGELAMWFDTFLEKLQGIIRQVAQSTERLAASSIALTATAEELNRDAGQMSERSESAAAAGEEASGNIQSVVAGVEEVSNSSNVVASAAEEVSSNLTTVSSAVEEVSASLETIASAMGDMTNSVGSVAAAMEEMSASLGEVSQNTASAARIANDATTEASQTAETVNTLGEAANKIYKVVDLITGIAAQTNLLALNATIEAASAGDAGKGFAVVANEVKELAKQTAAATEDIRKQIEEMQGDTQRAVTAIGGIVKTINTLDDAFGTTARMVDEQNSTLNEISGNIGRAAAGVDDVTRTVQEAARGGTEVARNVQEASSGVNEIARSIAELAGGTGSISANVGQAASGIGDMASSLASVNTAASGTKEEADRLTRSASELSEISRELKALMGQFRV